MKDKLSIVVLGLAFFALFFLAGLLNDWSYDAHSSDLLQICQQHAEGPPGSCSVMSAFSKAAYSAAKSYSNPIIVGLIVATFTLGYQTRSMRREIEELKRKKNA